MAKVKRYEFREIATITEYSDSNNHDISALMRMDQNSPAYIYGQTLEELKENIQKYIEKTKEELEDKLGRLERLSKSLKLKTLKEAEKNYQNPQLNEGGQI